MNQKVLFVEMCLFTFTLTFTTSTDHMTFMRYNYVILILTALVKLNVSEHVGLSGGGGGVSRTPASSVCLTHSATLL